MTKPGNWIFMTHCALTGKWPRFSIDRSSLLLQHQDFSQLTCDLLTALCWSLWKVVGYPKVFKLRTTPKNFKSTESKLFCKWHRKCCKWRLITKSRDVCRPLTRAPLPRRHFPVDLACTDFRFGSLEPKSSNPPQITKKAKWTNEGSLYLSEKGPCTLWGFHPFARQAISGSPRKSCFGETVPSVATPFDTFRSC